jgi:hypothetical protein
VPFAYNTLPSSGVGIRRQQCLLCKPTSSAICLQAPSYSGVDSTILRLQAYLHLCTLDRLEAITGSQAYPPVVEDPAIRWQSQISASPFRVANHWDCKPIRLGGIPSLICKPIWVANTRVKTLSRCLDNLALLPPSLFHLSKGFIIVSSHHSCLKSTTPSFQSRNLQPLYFKAVQPTHSSPEDFTSPEASQNFL